jgi:hypothetical protein
VACRWGSLAACTTGGVSLGLVGGLYNLVKQSLAASREARAEDTLTQQDAVRPREDIGDGR